MTTLSTPSVFKSEEISENAFSIGIYYSALANFNLSVFMDILLHGSYTRLSCTLVK